MLIPADANPIGVDLVDCRPITHGMVAFTSRQDIADSFTRLRESDGREHILPEPAQALTTNCRLVYPPATGTDDGPLFKAAQMEDMWDIYLYRPYLYFSRLAPIEYPAHFEKRLMSRNGGFRWASRRVPLSHLLEGQYIGLEEVDASRFSWTFGAVPELTRWTRFDQPIRSVSPCDA